jgi:hypothetical protein
MIELATDPTASRTSYRPVHGAGAAKEPGHEAKRGRPGHAWPFLSRYTPRTARQDSPKAPAGESGS